MEQRTLRIGDRIIYCYEDGSVEYYSKAPNDKNHPLVRTFGTNDGHGYKRIAIIVNGGRSQLQVHRLICMAFHSNPNNLCDVDHRNRIKSDNRPCNLRWASVKTNNDNQDRVYKSIAKYGVRKCDNAKAYYTIKNHHCLCIIKPDGTKTKTGYLSPEAYKALKPLSIKERYYKYQEIKSVNL